MKKFHYVGYEADRIWDANHTFVKVAVFRNKRQAEKWRSDASLGKPRKYVKEEK